MPITYKIDVIEELKKKGFTTYKLRKEEILSQSTIKCLQQRKSISFDSLGKICEILGLQPADIISYEPDENEVKTDLSPEELQEFLQSDHIQKLITEFRDQKHGK